MAAALPIFISAGEASGDLYGALLATALRERFGAVDLFGCGGERMREAGCETLVDAGHVAMVGLLEVLPGLPRAWRALGQLKAAIHRRRPELAVLIDFPDFNLRLARELKQLGVRVIYFVAPQVWAWRRGRLAALRRSVDRLLCIFPFEEKFFREAGVAAEFVGHPLVGRVAPQWTADEFRSRFHLPEARPVVALLPGSRRREISLNLPPMLAAVRRMAHDAEYSFVLAAPSRAVGDWIQAQTAVAGLPFQVVAEHTYDVLAHAAVAIVASGTATIETALLGTPMVVVYRVSSLSWWLGKLLVRTPYYSMVNLVAGQTVVPELIQGQFQPEAVAREARRLLENSEARSEMQRGLHEVVQKLRPPVGPDPAGTAIPNRESCDPVQRFATVAESILTERLGAVVGAGIDGKG